MISSSSDILMDSTQYTISIRSVNGAGTSNDSNITINSSLAPIVCYSGYDIVIINKTTSYITINARVSDDCRPSHPSSVSVHISCGNDDDPVDYTSDVIVNDDGLTKVSLFVPTGFIHCISNVTWSNSNSSISQSHPINTSPLYDVNITSISNGMINYTCHFRNYSQLKGCGISLDDNVSSVILYDGDSLMSTGSLILSPMCSDMIYNVTIFYNYINDDVNYTFNVTTVTVNSSNITCFPSPTESSQPTVTDSIMFSPSPTESSQFTVTDSSISPSTTSPSGPQLEYIIPIVILVVIVLVLIIVVVVLAIIIFNRKKKSYSTNNNNGPSTDLNNGVYGGQLNGGSNGIQSGQNGIEMTRITSAATVNGTEATVPESVPQNEMTETKLKVTGSEQGDVETEGDNLSKGLPDAYQYAPLSSDQNIRNDIHVSDDKEQGEALYLIPQGSAITDVVSGRTTAMDSTISSTSENTTWSGDYNKSSSDLKSLIRNKRSVSPQPLGAKGTGSPHTDIDKGYTSTNTKTHSSDAEPLLSHDSNSINQNVNTATALGNADLSYESNNSVKEKDDISDFTSPKEATS